MYNFMFQWLEWQPKAGANNYPAKVCSWGLFLN